MTNSQATIKCQRTTVNCQLSTVNCQLFWFIAPAVAAFLLGLAGCRHADTQDSTSASLMSKSDMNGKPNHHQVANVKIAMGRTLEQRGQTTEAVATYLEAVKEDPRRADAFVRLAVIHDQQGKFAESMNYYRKALNIQPDNPDIYCDVGYSFYLRSRWQDAEKSLRQAIALNADHSHAHNNLGSVLAHTGRCEEALVEYRKSGCTAADAHSNVAYALTLEHQLPEARKHYEQALAIEPSSERARKGLEELNRLCAKVDAGTDGS